MQPPAMTADEVAAHPAATVRVSCYLHNRTLYAGDLPPEGGADGVFAAAGCPDACPAALGEADPEPISDTPPPAGPPAPPPEPSSDLDAAAV